MPSDPSSSTHTTFRVKRGTKLADMHEAYTEEVPALTTLNGPFQLSEYLALKVKHDPHDVKALVDIPKAEGGSGKAPEKNVWIYEHLRRLPIDLTPLLTSLLTICSRESCPEMKADQWLYFCSAHQNTEECCAIDYILHTVDSTTALLNSTKQFPSRMSIPTTSLSHFPSLFRRISRIFSHAYFHHREAFHLSELENSLYARFVALCERFDLVGPNLLVIPREVVGAYKERADSDDSDEEEDEEEEEEDEEEDEEEESEEESDTRGRGEKGETKEKRTRSLDRHGPPSSLDMPKAARSGTILPDPAATPLAEDTNASPKKADPSWSSPQSLATLSRGKQPRGTMLWNSDMSSMPAIPVGLELSRTESNQTAVLLDGPEETAEEDVAGEAEEVEVVPKDEIELLEEEGVLPSETAVSPLPPPAEGEEGAETETRVMSTADEPEDTKSEGKGEEDTQVKPDQEEETEEAGSGEKDVKPDSNELAEEKTEEKAEERTEEKAQEESQPSTVDDKANEET